MKVKLLIASLLFIVAVSIASAQQKYKTSEVVTVVTKKYEGAIFTSEKSFVENMASTAKFSYLSTILEDESLLEMLNEKEMITVFAPKNEAFTKMGEETRDSILSNQKLVIDILKRHVIPGRVDGNSIRTGIENNGGIIHYNTLANNRIGFKLNENDQIIMIDTAANTAVVTSEDYMHKNGFFHVVDGLIFPASKE